MAACVVVAIAAAAPAVPVRAADVELGPTVHHPMSRYVDVKYRFSFWHLSALRITVAAANDEARFPGGVTVETVQVGSPGGVSLYVVNSPQSTIVLDMDFSESPTYGEQEGSAYNGHFGCTCYHPLFVFNQLGIRERCALRSGNVHSAADWRAVLEPVIARYRGTAKRLYFRGPRSARTQKRSSSSRCAMPTARWCRWGGGPRGATRRPGADHPLQHVPDGLDQRSPAARDQHRRRPGDHGKAEPGPATQHDHRVDRGELPAEAGRASSSSSGTCGTTPSAPSRWGWCWSSSCWRACTRAGRRRGR